MWLQRVRHDWETFTYLGFPDSAVGKESTCNAGDPGSIPRSGRSAGEGIGYPLQYSWAFFVAQLVKNLPAMQETWVWSLSWEDPLEKERLPISVFWPGEFHGLYMYSPWGHKELDAIEQLSLSLPHYTNYIPEVYCWTALLQQHFVKDNRLFLLPLNPVLGW